MRVSYNWLQEYFDQKLPEAKKLADALTMHAYEVESIEKAADDFVFNIDVLPNRAPDSFCHDGVAKEVSSILDLPLKKRPVINVDISDKVTKIDLDIKSDLCIRYIGRVVENIKVAESPDWLKQKLEVLGQRSINNIVDATNLIMLETGQPMHAFELSKIEDNKIVVRVAVRDEKMVTLDDKEIALDENVLIIADGKKPLAIAGIKGGKSAEISTDTKSLFLESANFEAVNIRKTSKRIGIRTESSLRFEHSISPSLADKAMNRLTELLLEVAKTDSTRIGLKIDNYSNPEPEYFSMVSLEKVNSLLGLHLSVPDVGSILKRLNFEHSASDNVFKIKIPAERVDLIGLNEKKPRPEYIIEEIGRIYGYEKIGTQFPREETKPPRLNSRYFYTSVIKDILIGLGFSEVYNYSLVKEGDVMTANPMADDKGALRKTLISGLRDNLKSNLYNLEDVKIFEFGTTFSKTSDEIKEHNMLGLILGRRNTKKADSLPFYETKGYLDILFDELNVSYFVNDQAGDYELVVNNEVVGHIWTDGSAEIDLDRLMPHIKYYEFTYVPISKFPPVDRDISLYVTADTNVSDVEKIIKDSAGELMVELYPFDIFQKGDKKSFAFRLVFQSKEKTLQDEEVNDIVNSIIKKLEEDPSWQVRK